MYLHSLMRVECDGLGEESLHTHQHSTQSLNHSQQFCESKLLLLRVVVADSLLVVAGVVWTGLVEERVGGVTQLPIVHVVQLAGP